MSDPATPARAFVRSVGPDFADCLRQGAGSIDVDRARSQHAGYVAALRDAGVEVTILDALPGFPDAPFIEDAAIVLGGDPPVLISTRPGAQSRAAEAAATRDDLASYFSPREMATGRLDGGDVLRLGARLYVGLSTRTDREGMNALGAIVGDYGVSVHAVPLSRGLHLKSVCSALDGQTILFDPRAADERALRSIDAAKIPVPDPTGANVLAFGDRILCSTTANETAAALVKRGFAIVTVSISEFETADAALSCLSLREPPDGAWSV